MVFQETDPTHWSYFNMKTLYAVGHIQWETTKKHTIMHKCSEHETCFESIDVVVTIGWCECEKILLMDVTLSGIVH